MNGVDVKPIVDNYNFFCRLNTDRARGDPLEDAISDGELVRVVDGQPRQRYVGEVALVEDQLLYIVSGDLKHINE